MRLLVIGGEISLFCLGVAATLLITYVTSSDPVTKGEWLGLLAVGIPSAVVYGIALWERF